MPNAVQRQLRKVGVQVTHYRFTPAARRARLLEHLGIRELLDVGANTGQYATEVRNHGYRGRLWSFEPVSSPFGALARAAADDVNWQAFHMAISDEPGELTIHVSEGTEFSSAIPLVRHEGRPLATQVSTETVRAESLDGFLPTLALSGPVGLKVDVQGFESAVFRGAVDTLKQVEFLEFEMSCVEIYEGADLLPTMMQRMYDRGFVLALAEPAWMLDTGRGLQMNGIFVRRDSPVATR